MNVKTLALTWIIIIGILSIPFMPFMDPDWEDYADCSGAFLAAGNISESKEFTDRSMHRAREQDGNVSIEMINMRIANVASRIINSEDRDVTRRAYFKNCGIE